MARDITEGYKEIPLTDRHADEVESGGSRGSPEILEPTNNENKGKPTQAAPLSPRTAHKVKYVALFTLVFQNTTLILMMKMASQTKAGDGRNALTTTAVVMVETFKVTACLLEMQWRRRSSGGAYTEIKDEIFGKPRESMLLLLPSFLYLLQNNLLFVAVANLEAAVYQVTAQLKILTTAGFSVLLLAASSNPATVGLVCALLAQCTSGFAGVFCEKMLKGGGGASMVVRNIQLGVPALVFGLAGIMLKDYESITQYGFFQGYTNFTWAVIVLHSFGGLLVTVIMKYADNIAKTFAIAVSLVLSSFLSVYLFNFTITSLFFLGGSMVIYSTFAFSGYGVFGLGQSTSASPTFQRKAAPENMDMEEIKISEAGQERTE
eukprot:CAMPEP_0180409002 /NCGR_PEP_ID=MMETSP0989-20121125/42570_1 /TAXON_ID=697907 /ORGANISM="non described non described, Strain CCMP2293" /LENGTH=376 /DNA_ID=CAMNT_0022412963 /DNA_START=143 /DNA_END=1274 /DNA_ORIENTATION=+